MKIYVWLARLILAVLVFMLVAVVVRCSPGLSKKERKEKRAKKLYAKAVDIFPAIIDSVVHHDTVHHVDTLVIHSANTLTEETVDSILTIYCDTTKEKKEEIKRYIVDRATHESLLKGKAKVFNVIGGTIILTAKGNDLSIISDIKTVKETKTVYVPSTEWEEEKKDLKKQHRRELIDWTLIALLVGFLLFPIVKFLIRTL